MRFEKQEPGAQNYGYLEIMNYFKKLSKDSFINGPSLAVVQAAIKKYYSYLVNLHIRDSNPAINVRLKFRKKNIFHQDLFSTTELQILLHRTERYKFLTYRNKLLISLMIFQGLSVAEITKLRTRDIDIDLEQILVKASNRKRRRYLELLASQMVILNKYLNTERWKLLKSESDRLLIGKTGHPITKDEIHYLVSTNQYLFPDRKLCPETIRQSAIANWLNVFKIPLADAQILAGHKRPSTTARYRQPDLAEQLLILNKVHPF
jgi:site-specific recombinase XerD